MLDRNRVYPLVCWVFTGSFSVVLLGLLFIPEQMADWLNLLSGAFGLTGGEIAVGSGDLDHVLALSLMGCIVALATGSAMHPEPREPFVALIVAKVISTGGFGLLAVLDGGVWLIPSLADGFVIAGLGWARYVHESAQS